MEWLAILALVFALAILIMLFWSAYDRYLFPSSYDWYFLLFTSSAYSRYMKAVDGIGSANRSGAREKKVRAAADKQLAMTEVAALGRFQREPEVLAGGLKTTADLLEAWRMYGV